MGQVIRYVVGHHPGMAGAIPGPGEPGLNLWLRLSYIITFTVLTLFLLTASGSAVLEAGASGLAPARASGKASLGPEGDRTLPAPGETKAGGRVDSEPVAVTPGAGVQLPAPPQVLQPQPAVTGDAPAGGRQPAGEKQSAPDLSRFTSLPLREVPGAGPRVALTFDDGPYPGWTPRYLDALAAVQAPATFFLVGRQAEAYPELVQAVLEGGHEIGNHSWRHANLGKASLADAGADLRRAGEALARISGRPVHYFRPPYGATGPGLLAAAAQQGVLTVTWNIDPRDWSDPGPQAIIKNVMTNVRGGSIILLHENHPGTLEALPPLIAELRRQGYELVTMSELIAGGQEE